jgi:predicted pyridoxine 5'-phosphate oxidase superfamily flavin-nucleotide-binding protein
MSTPTPPSGWPHERSPFHPAELALQERFGQRKTLDVRARRTVRGVLIEQHRQFYAQLPFILVGTVDATGQPWASMLAGHPGFVSSPGAKHLRFDMAPIDRDPVKDGLALGAPVGVLGIEPSTRRRNRISDRVSTVDEHGFTVEVVQSYGNCPQYNQSRALDFLRSAPLPHEIIRAHSSDTSRPARSPRTAPGRQQRSTRAAIQAKRHRNETAAAAKTTRRIAPLQVHTRTGISEIATATKSTYGIWVSSDA